MPLSLASQMIRYALRMDQKHWVANHDGNISAKTGDELLLITPGARAKGDLVESDLIEVNFSGKKVSGTGNSFSELAMHLLVYKARPDIGAVVHAHPPAAMAVGCTNQEMMTWAVPEAVVSLGPGVPLVSLGLPGSKDLELEFSGLIPHFDAVMVAGNGVFSWGKNLEQAFLRLELVEHLATIFLRAQALGGPHQLKPEQVVELLNRRQKAGLALPPDPQRPQWFPA